MNKSKPRNWVSPLALSLLVLIIGVIAAGIDLARSRSEIDEWTASKAEVVESVVQDVIDEVFSDLEAVAGFIEQSDPTPESFDAFVTKINGTADAIGIGYIANVPAALADDHIEEMRASLGEFYDLFALGADGLPEPVDRTDREAFYPLQFFAYGDLIAPLVTDDLAIAQIGIGVDAGFVETWRDEIDTAMTAEGGTLSQFITLESETFSFDRAFFASVPLTAGPHRPDGIVGALMSEPLLLQNLDKRSLDDVQWEVVPIAGAPARLNSSEIQVFPLDLPGNPWLLAVAPTAETTAALLGLPFWVTGLIAAALAALTFTVMWLLMDRRAEHRQSAQLRLLAEEKDRFLASVSHELRTPLTVVSGFANELHDKPEAFSPAENQDLLAMMVEQTDELSAIVEDLLIAARSDIGKVVINLQETDLAVEATRAMETAGITAPIHGERKTAIADEQRVRQILRNLLTNAKRYGGAAVRVEFSDGPGWVEVAVVDDGEGIPEEKRKSVFDAYVSAHRPDIAVKSVGLGLFISRGLAIAMGGDLRYDYSEGWSRFSLRLPTGASKEVDETPTTAQLEPVPAGTYPAL